MVGTTTLHGGCVRYFVYMRATVCSNPTRPYQSAPSSRRAFVVVARGISTHYTDSVDLDGMATLPPPPLPLLLWSAFPRACVRCRGMNAHVVRMVFFRAEETCTTPSPSGGISGTLRRSVRLVFITHGASPRRTCRPSVFFWPFFVWFRITTYTPEDEVSWVRPG